MFNVKHAIIGAEGDIRIGTFKMTKAKSDGFDTPQQLDRFLRTKLKHKGLHTRWKRYGSWTFTDDNDNASHLYVWSTTKGTTQHKYTYQLDDSSPLEAYDDMMLMRFPADTSPITLNNHLDITQDHVKEWLECVLHRDEKKASSTNKKTSSANKKAKTKSKASKPKAKTQKHTDPTNETLDEANNDGDSDDDDDVLDVDEAVTAEDENILEDTLDDTENNKELLLDEDEDEDDDDDDDVGSDDEANRVSDDEDDDFESAFDTDMLEYEEYTYKEPNKLVKKPLLLSLWTN